MTGDRHDEGRRQHDVGTVSRTRRPVLLAMVVGLALVLPIFDTGTPALAQTTYQRISGEGSSWSANFVDAMRVELRQIGVTVDYNPAGSTAGRRGFLNGTVDFAVSDVPFQTTPEGGSPPEIAGGYAYVPITAGGTAFVYNLRIGGQQVTNLRLSGENITKIFTGVITQWNDPALLADNPGLRLPARSIVPVVRSDGAGTTQQLTSWMAARHPSIWVPYCQGAGRSSCGSTSFYPTPPGGVAQGGDVGVAGYVSQNFAEGAIGYVNYSYALGVRFPVAKVLNAAGFYTEPTPNNVAVSLTRARVRDDPGNPATHLTADLAEVYNNLDPRNYELSGYSYLIVPTSVRGQFNEAKGRTLASFTSYSLCEGQQAAAGLGYAPLPLNLVEAGLAQARRIPGGAGEVATTSSNCNNPTFSPDGTNRVVRDAPQPQPCDRRGGSQCADGTGGLAAVPTATAPPVIEAAAQYAPESGPSATPITLSPTSAPAFCPGDTSSGWFVQTFLASATNDPALLSYDGNGPRGAGFVTALRDQAGNALVDLVTEPGTGELPALPTISFESFARGAVPTGSYHIGLACTDGGRTGAVWSARITITANTDGGPGAFEFGPAQESAVVVQRIDVTRPVGALILTQRCGVAGALPADPAVAGFPGYPFDLAAVAARADTVGTPPTLGADGSGPPDPEFDDYPFPEPATYPTTCGINLGTAAIVRSGPLAGQYFAADGRLDQLTVVDTRDADSGWTLSGSMSPFADLAASFSGNYAGWSPVVTRTSMATPQYVTQATAGPAVLPGSGIDSGTGLAEGALMASAPAGSGLGFVEVDARIKVLVPVGTPTAAYTATLAFSLA